MRPLVIVRPQPGADTTARAARALGIEAIVMSLFAVEPVAWRAPDPAAFDGLLLTSANAPRCAGAELDQLVILPAYCVGAATAAAARKAGLSVAATGTAGVDALLQSLPADLRLLHLGGADRRAPADATKAISPVTVYGSAELPRPADFAQLEGSVVAIHSPRAGAVLASHVDAAGLDRATIAVAAISAAAAETAGSGWGDLAVAEHPADPELLAISLRLCKKPR
ncbi:uroporphyrinogen-III synthase [Sphingomonas sabuli]|uniref:Uroporphyrinogen-III synthase n=1 Tax=Sphingomonas sabuli TaxID=2764186 RepID=A0A7G9L0C9_9SPHN|nr:uroporphyrinogen-III synthase [Sphingomonas sabuli]QNM82078.1 uroporphyrinogen-III synthase [Sphingomonas sabuli]